MSWPQFGKRKPIERRVVVAMKAPVGPDGDEIDIDERWMGEYADMGVAALTEYLAKHAAFAAWEADHNRSQAPDQALD